MPKINFVKAPDYVETYATSIWGGLGPKGDLKITFVEDMYEYPDSITLVDKGNGIFEETPVQSIDLIRKKKCMISLPVSEVPSFIEWLQEKFNQYVASNPNATVNLRASSPEQVAEFEKKYGIKIMTNGAK